MRVGGQHRKPAYIHSCRHGQGGCIHGVSPNFTGAWHGMPCLPEPGREQAGHGVIHTAKRSLVRLAALIYFLGPSFCSLEYVLVASAALCSLSVLYIINYTSARFFWSRHADLDLSPHIMAWVRLFFSFTTSRQSQVSSLRLVGRISTGTWPCPAQYISTVNWGPKLCDLNSCHPALFLSPELSPQSSDSSKKGLEGGGYACSISLEKHGV